MRRLLFLLALPTLVLAQTDREWGLATLNPYGNRFEIVNLRDLDKKSLSQIELVL